MKRKVVLTPAARDDAHRIDNWWRENRPAAAGLFGEELAASLSLLEVAPEMGRPYRHPGIPRLRHVLLRSTRYHVYYVIGDEAVISSPSGVRSADGSQPWRLVVDHTTWTTVIAAGCRTLWGRRQGSGVGHLNLPKLQASTADALEDE